MRGDSPPESRHNVYKGMIVVCYRLRVSHSFYLFNSMFFLFFIRFLYILNYIFFQHLINLAFLPLFHRFGSKIDGPSVVNSHSIRHHLI